jgi:hypothetical protein
VTRLRLALVADDVVLGGGNSRRIKKLPAQARPGRQCQCFPRWLPALGRRSCRRLPPASSARHATRRRGPIKSLNKCRWRRWHLQRGRGQFGNETGVPLLALGGALAAEIESLATDLNKGLPSPFVQTVLGSAETDRRPYPYALSVRGVVTTPFALTYKAALPTAGR